MPSRTTTLAHILSVLLGVFSIYTGAWSTLSPLSFAETFGLPPQIGDFDPWIYCFASRQFATGVAILTLAYMRDWKAVTVLVLTLLFWSVNDLTVPTKYGGGWDLALQRHGPGSAVVLILGIFLWSKHF